MKDLLAKPRLDFVTEVCLYAKLKMAPIGEKTVKENDVDDAALTRNIWYFYTYNIILGRL